MLRILFNNFKSFSLYFKQNQITKGAKIKRGYLGLHTAFYLLLYCGRVVTKYDDTCERNVTCTYTPRECADNIRTIHNTLINTEKCQADTDDNVPSVRLIYKFNDNANVLNQIIENYSDVRNEITILDISENLLYFQPTIGSEMNKLTAINLSYNNLETAYFYNSGYELNYLKEIDFSHNVITTLEVDEGPYEFVNLKKINLSYNDICKINDLSFRSFNVLQYLDLSNNQITDITSNTFEGISSLKYLNLSFNNITDMNTAFFRFYDLIELNLSNNKISKIVRNNLNNLNKLQFLDLSSNLISTVDVFDDLPRLVNIDLSGNKLERLASNLFTATIQIDNINLSNNNITHIPKNMFLRKNISMFSIKGNNITGSLERGVFEGLDYITELDISHQSVTSIGDYSFLGLIRMTKLLLNNNLIHSISSKTFTSLKKLMILDLSYNRITDIDFEKSDLGSLKSLSFSNNLVERIKVDQLFDLHRLQYLDLSQNNITQLPPKAFQSLTSLDNIILSNNPITGTLEENTFEGLFSIPFLDLSGTSLNLIKNNSFDGMVHLYDLNISHSKVAEVQYNTFLNAENIETIDLSYNQIENFAVNNSHLKFLKDLRIDNNIIKTLSQSFVTGLLLLKKITLSHNHLLTLHSDTFQDQTLLNYLDLSFNLNFYLDFSLLRNANYLDTLIISGISSNITFKEIKEIPLTKLDISNSRIGNISNLGIQKFKNIQILLLDNNNITHIEFGAFANISSIKEIDISYNSIESIEPGAFKDCHELQTLNISHNSLSEIRYGVFKGLMHLYELDISYNYISSLDTTRLYDLQELSELIVDHNKINEVSVEDLLGTRLTKISIGDNPLPCESLIKLIKYSGPKLQVTSIRYIEFKDENHNGMRCNYNKHIPNQRIVKSESNKNNETVNENLLIDIRDILLNISSKNIQYNEKSTVNRYDTSLTDNIVQLKNSSFNIEKENINTNKYFERLLKLVAAMNSLRPEVSRLQGNGNDSNKNDIDKLKVEIDNKIIIEKEKMLSEVSDKLTVINQRIDSLIHSTTLAPLSEHQTFSKEVKPSLFIEICVVLTLTILVCFVLYKVYKSRCYIVNRWSASTGRITEMENSNL